MGFGRLALRYNPPPMLEEVMHDRHALFRTYGWPEATNLASGRETPSPRTESDPKDEASH